jgi:ABC-type sugar transport system ATPase subunit
VRGIFLATYKKESSVDSCACVQMGPSGSGKTTLLDVLAGRKTQGEVTGDILFSAQKPSINFLRRFTGYVEQFDTLLDILTVREMLLYTAEMKRSVKEPLSVKEAIVDKYISVLGLDVCKDTKIGNSMNRFAYYYHRSLSLHLCGVLLLQASCLVSYGHPARNNTRSRIA